MCAKWKVTNAEKWHLLDGMIKTEAVSIGGSCEEEDCSFEVLVNTLATCNSQTNCVAEAHECVEGGDKGIISEFVFNLAKDRFNDAVED